MKTIVTVLCKYFKQRSSSSKFVYCVSSLQPNLIVGKRTQFYWHQSQHNKIGLHLHSAHLHIPFKLWFSNRLFNQGLSVRFFSSEKEKVEWEDLHTRKENELKLDAIPIKKENVYTVPNLLCLVRIMISPYLGYLVIHQSYTPALIIALIAAATDLADGYIARRWPSQQSAVGSALDPLADKVLISILALTLTYVNIIPVALAALFVGRDVSLVAAAFFVRLKTCPRPLTLKRYFDPTLVNAKLSPTSLSKFNTFLQMLVIWSSLASPAFGFVDHILLKTLWGLSACTTVASGIGYITRRDTVRVLKKENDS